MPAKVRKTVDLIASTLQPNERLVPPPGYAIGLSVRNDHRTKEQVEAGVPKWPLPEPNKCLTSDELRHLCSTSLNESHAVQRVKLILTRGKEEIDQTPTQTLPEHIQNLVKQEVERELAKLRAQIPVDQVQKIEDQAVERAIEVEQKDEEFKKLFEKPWPEAKRAPSPTKRTQLKRAEMAMVRERARKLGYKDVDKIKFNGGLVYKINKQWAEMQTKIAAEQIVNEAQAAPYGDATELAIQQEAEKAE